MLTEIREPVALGTVGCGVRPVDVIPMGERHVAGTELVEDSQYCRGIFDHMPALDPQEAGDLAGSVNAFDVVRGAGLLESRVSVHGTKRDVEFAHRLVQGDMRILSLRLHEYRPVLSADSAFP